LEGTIGAATLPAAVDQYRFGAFLPYTREEAVTMGEGATPLVDCASVAEKVGVERLLVKDEGANPTGSTTDRGASMAVTAASATNVETVGLPSTGHAGRSVAAYAGVAGLDASVFVPSRAPFDCKAMINVHGGEMTVAGGRYPDAADAFEADRAEEWADLGPGSVYRREGAVALYGELVESLDWQAPDALVVPASHGATLVGLAAAIERFRAAELATGSPTLIAAQPEGCAPIVDAINSDGQVDPVEHPDTIAGALEIPGSALGELGAAAVRDMDGRGATVTDDGALAAAVDATAAAGVEVGVAGGVALAAAAEAELGDDDTVVALNPTAGGTESDVLRSHLMGRGV
jgi:threonine synthase